MTVIALEPGHPERRMRWPKEGESMHDYAQHVIDVMEKRGVVVRAHTHQGAVEALRKIAAGDVPGTGDFADCVQAYAQATLARHGGQ